MRALALLALAGAGCGGAASDDRDAGADAATRDAAASLDALDPDAAPIIDGPAPSCPANQWCKETPPAGTTALRAVAALGATDVFAVGDGGVILRRQNETWTAMQSGTTANLFGVWAISATNVWVVGAAGTVRHWDGAAWTAVSGVLNIDYTGVWASSATNVVLVGSSKVQTWNGATWTAKTLPGTLNGVHGTGPSDVWVATETQGLAHFTGTWSDVATGTGTTIFAVLAIAANDVWISASGADSVHYNGATWTTIPAGYAFTEYYAATSADIWAIAQTKVGHWNGTAWAVATPSGVTDALRAVDGRDGHLWVVGASATILHRH